MASFSSPGEDMQNEMKLELRKGMQVEVTSNEEGFINAWYSATIVETPCPTSSSKQKRNKAMVEYHTLVTDDGSKPLREYVSVGFIRPLPPPLPAAEAEAASDDENNNHKTNSRRFEEDDVVDAFYHEGWWTGVVCRVLENDRFRVYFDSPPDVMEFDLQNLRVHQGWIHGKWVHSENNKKKKKQQSTQSIFSSGQEVEVNLDDETSIDTWFTAIFIKEIQGCFLVKYKSSRDGDESGYLKVTVDSLHVRPIRPPCVDRDYELSEKVEAVNEFGWRIGEITNILADRKYEVFFELSQEFVQLDHTKLRPYMRWIGGKWISTSETTTITKATKERKGMSPNFKLKMLKTSPADKVGTRGTAAVALHREDEVVTGDTAPSMGSVPKAKEATYQHEEVNSNNKKRQRPSKSNIRSPVPFKTGFSSEKVVKKRRTCYASKHKRTAAESSNTPVDEIMPLCMLLPGVHSHTGAKMPRLLLDRKADQHTETPQVVAPQELFSVNNTVDDVSVMNTPLPFVKGSPVWKTLESMEVFKMMPQQPHFLPLHECKEHSREGNAIGMMVTFACIAEKVSKLKIDDPRSTFSSALEILPDLENHGFDVDPLRIHVLELLSIKDRLLKLQEGARVTETKIIELTQDEIKFADEVNEIELEMTVLQDRLMLVKSKMKKACNDINSLRSGLKSFKGIIHDTMLECDKLVGSPFQK